MKEYVKKRKWIKRGQRVNVNVNVISYLVVVLLGAQTRSSRCVCTED